MMGSIYFERPMEYREHQSTLDGEMWIECDGMYMLVEADWVNRDGDRCRETE